MSNIEQMNQHIKGLTAQLDAAKQMVNEALQTILQLKTNHNLLQNAYNELHAEHSNAVQELDKHKSIPEPANDEIDAA